MKAHILSLRNAMIAWALIYATAAITMEVRPFFLLLNCILLCVAAAVVFGYSRGLLTRSVTYESKLLIMGILCTWVAGVYNRVIEIWRATHSTVAIPAGNSDAAIVFTTIGLFIATVGGTLHLLAPGSIEGVIPDRNWLRAAIAFGLGLLGFLILGVVGA